MQVCPHGFPLSKVLLFCRVWSYSVATETMSYQTWGHSYRRKGWGIAKPDWISTGFDRPDGPGTAGIARVRGGGMFSLPKTLSPLGFCASTPPKSKRWFREPLPLARVSLKSPGLNAHNLGRGRFSASRSCGSAWWSILGLAGDPTSRPSNKRKNGR